MSHSKLNQVLFKPSSMLNATYSHICTTNSQLELNLAPDFKHLPFNFGFVIWDSSSYKICHTQGYSLTGQPCYIMLCTVCPYSLVASTFCTIPDKAYHFYFVWAHLRYLFKFFQLSISSRAPNSPFLTGLFYYNSKRSLLSNSRFPLGTATAFGLNNYIRG